VLAADTPGITAVATAAAASAKDKVLRTFFLLRKVD